ncbi:hypothetical protein N9R31_00025 [bacterium]|nr:hypothetical protein [bacterium]
MSFGDEQCGYYCSSGGELLLKKMQPVNVVIFCLFAIVAAPSHALDKPLQLWDFVLGESIDSARQKIKNLCGTHREKPEFLSGFNCQSKFTGKIDIEIKIGLQKSLFRSGVIDFVSYTVKSDQLSPPKLTNYHWRFFGDEWLRFKEDRSFGTPTPNHCDEKPTKSGMQPKNVVEAFIAELPTKNTQITKEFCVILIKPVSDTSFNVGATSTKLKGNGRAWTIELNIRIFKTGAQFN